MLRYLPDATWDKLPLDDFRARFFVETFSEKLRMHTPHFYQARLMNLFSACNEMIQYVEEVQGNEKNSAYVTSSMKEIEQCWDTDPVAQELFANFSGLKENLEKSVRGGDVGQSTLHRIRVFCRAILSRQEKYTSALLIALEEAVVGAADLNQRDRITTQIDRLTGLYTTHLLNKGYSPTYLFNRVDMFSREGNYSDRNFSQQFRFITERLRSHKISVDVYYAIRTNKPSNFLSITDDPDFKFTDVVPPEINGADLEKFKKNIEITLVAKSRMEATDHVSAALRTKEKLDRILDAATALELNSHVQVSAHCVVIYQIQNSTHKHTLNVDMLLAFMSSEIGSSFTHPQPSIRQTFKGLNEAATDQLGRSLRYLRLARHSVSLEQKLLNLWISLESLFADLGAGILSNILEYVPLLHATAGLRRRVAYLRELLVANDIQTTEAVRLSIIPDVMKFDGSVTDSQIFLILMNESVAIDLFNNLNNREHLKFRLMQIFNELKNNKSIGSRLSRSEDDVARQLRRIYFLRNKIAHTGHYKGVRPQLITHLLDYVAICYRAISTASASAETGTTYSIVELLTAAKMGSELVVARAAVKDPITTLESILPMPII